MAHNGPVTDRRTIVHVVPSDLNRGAQKHVSELRTALGGAVEHHVAVALFRAPAGRLGPALLLDVPSGRMRRLGFDVRALWRLRRALTRLRPAVVVAHGGEALKYAVPSSRAPVIYHRIGISGMGQRGVQTALYRRLAARAALVVAVSADTAEEVRRTLGLEEGAVRVVPNGRDPAAYSPAVPSPGPPRLVFVGHLTGSKRPELFLRAVAEVGRRGHGVEGVMVGDGPMLDQIKSDAPPEVRVLGARDDVPALLTESDVFVFTSIEAGEGLPGVLIEAAMSGLPIVATRVPGATDVIEHGTTGLLVAPDDEAGLVDAVERLVGDEEMRTRMGTAARRRAVAELSLERSAAGWRAAIDAVAGPLA